MFLQKCVLYWPEKRGIYGKVEVLVNSMRECEHYTIRHLTVKVRHLSGHLHDDSHLANLGDRTSQWQLVSATKDLTDSMAVYILE